jgi:uncharacterized protein YdaU (DUF1376 family)
MFIEENSKPKEKLKAWYLFTEDFIAGTQHLTNEQIGIYIRLLCWNWNKRCAGIPSNNMTIYRIANCITDDEKQSCNIIIKEFFVYINDHYQNERQLEEYLYISRRMEASRENGKLGGRPKKPSNNPPTPTTTPTNTSKPTKTRISNSSNFNRFWKNIPNKVSKGIAEKNFLKLEPEWLENPEHLADMYKNYYESIEDKQFAKQPAFWLSAKKYLDEQPIKKKDNSPADPYKNRVNMFKEAIEAKNGTAFIRSYAQRYPSDVERAIGEGQFTKEEAKQYLDFRG